MALKRQHGDKWAFAGTLLNMGLAARQQGSEESAQAFWEEALALYRELGDEERAQGILNNPGDIALARGDCARSVRLQTEALRTSWEYGARVCAACAREGLATAATFQGQIRSAIRLWAAVEELRRAADSPLPLYMRGDLERDQAAARDQIDEVTWTTWWEESRSMPLEQIVAEAVHGRDSDVTGASGARN